MDFDDISAAAVVPSSSSADSQRWEVDDINATTTAGGAYSSDAPTNLSTAVRNDSFVNIAKPKPPASEEPEPSTTTTTTEAEDNGAEEQAKPAPPTPFRKLEHPRNYVVVHAVFYTAVGALACLLLTLALVTFTANATAPWCAYEMSVFRDVMLAAAIADVLAAQPLIIALTFVWRWLQTENDDDDDIGDDAVNQGRRHADFDEEYDQETGAAATSPGCGQGQVAHELHPIDGQWRLVGPPADGLE